MSLTRTVPCFNVDVADLREGGLAMKLELDVFNVKDVQFAEETAISDRILYISHNELQDLLQQDERLTKVDIELTHPGQSCRILQVADVIEPRAKTRGTIEDFPGALGKIEKVGEGSTCVLRGVAVVINDQTEASELGDSDDAMGNIIDMSGPGAEFSLYAKTHNVVVMPYPADGISREGYRIAIKLAGLKAAAYLAQAAKELEPDEVEVYDLPPLTKATKGMETLPKVGYIFQICCTSYPGTVGEPILYGDNVRLLLPTIIHPNEVFDGAIVNPYGGGGIGMETYVIQNHPVIKDLYRRHGKDLCFVGVILTVSRYTEPERERSVVMACNLAKSLLGADGVVITKVSSGAPDIDVAQTAQRCEELGVKAVLIMFDRSLASETGTVFNLPRANAIVTTANSWAILSLPAVGRTIGRPVVLSSGGSSDGEVKKPLRWIRGGLDQLGHSKIMSVRY